MKNSKSINHKFNTINEIQLFNEFTGRYFFEAGAMRSFGSKVYPCIYRGRFFVTSEKDRFSNRPRLYTIRMANTGGSIETVGGFQAFSTKAQAERFITKYLTFEHSKLMDLSIKFFNTGRFSKLMARTIKKNPKAWEDIKELELLSSWLPEWVDNKLAENQGAE